jgi:hypothetical protein
MPLKLHCPTCGTEVRSYEKDCPSCGSFCWFPNVRKAEETDETGELDKRYTSARAAVTARGREPVFLAYEAALVDSVAVVCRSLDQVKALLSNESDVYTTYYIQRSGGGRRAEETPIEIQREATDVRVFPSYHEHIRFGALSLDGKGLIHLFGACSLVLKSIAVRERTSVFWENTVDFCNRVCPDQKEAVPLGYRAPWPMRAKLAAAKGEPRLDRQSTSEEFSRILLDGSRFVEVHIYGPFNRNSIDRLLVPRVAGKSAQAKSDRAIISAIRDVIRIAGLGIVVEEYK